MIETVMEKLLELLGRHIVCANSICNFCEHHKSSYACELHKRQELAKYLIANGVSIQEWFPTSEPPKERGRYLCYFKYEPESPDVVCENTYYGSGHWMSEKDRVTHWSYLPKLPEGN